MKSCSSGLIALRWRHYLLEDLFAGGYLQTNQRVTMANFKCKFQRYHSACLPDRGRRVWNTLHNSVWIVMRHLFTNTSQVQRSNVALIILAIGPMLDACYWTLFFQIISWVLQPAEIIAVENSLTQFLLAFFASCWVIFLLLCMPQPLIIRPTPQITGIHFIDREQ